MARIKFNKSAMRKLERQVQRNLEPIEAEANKAAAKESTPANKAHAYARVLKRHGIDVDERELTKKFGAL